MSLGKLTAAEEEKEVHKDTPRMYFKKSDNFSPSAQDLRKFTILLFIQMCSHIISCYTDIRLCMGAYLVRVQLLYKFTFQ